ncbi:MAG: RES domain-containing protein [Proteobacteria bacterium]|nr:RES domain-containing protein [Pseudomonadota bacterium]
MHLWRIATGTHPIWSGEGARLFGQRWNPPGLAAIYAGTSFAISLLEIMVHANRKTPPSAARCVRAAVPEDIPYETFEAAAHPGWDDPFDVGVARAFGELWLREARSAVLIVPSAVTGGRDRNAVVNPAHPDARRIAVDEEERVRLDPRLWGESAS